MGKAKIVAHKGKGFYSALIIKDETGYTRNIATATARITELDTNEIPELEDQETAAAIKRVNEISNLNTAIDDYNAGDITKEKLAEQSAITAEAILALETVTAQLEAARVERETTDNYKTTQQALQATATAGVARDIWSADLTTAHVADDIVGIFDVSNETFNTRKTAPGGVTEDNTSVAIIRPEQFTASNSDYSAARDGIERASSGDPPSGAMTFYNWAVKPAWQIGKPTARIAEIVSLDYGLDEADVRVLNIDSWVRNFQTKPFGEDADAEYGIYRGVPVEYDTCNARAFSEGDLVVLEFEGQSETPGGSTGPRVVGFKSHPKQCTSDGFNFTRYDVAGPYAILEDVGAGWAVDVTGSPTVVEGNIDVQTHGQTRTTGGKVPDPIRFKGPYRRHFGQFMDDDYEESAQPVRWGQQWYSDRKIEGTAPGKILGIGSQDDSGGDTVYVIAALDEATVSASAEPANTVGFYRRLYNGTVGLYDPFSNANGWRKVGSHTFHTSLFEGHDTAFFFNSAGTECAHIRHSKLRTAVGTFQARATKGDNAATPTLKNLTPPKIHHPILFTFTFAKDYVTAVVATENDSEMEDVTFKREELTAGNLPPYVRIQSKGSWPIAAEYLHDQLCIARYSVDYLEEQDARNTVVTSPPTLFQGTKTHKIRIDNKLTFTGVSFSGTADTPDTGDTVLVLKDTTVGFTVNGAEVGQAITNDTTGKMGMITEILSDSKIVTTVMLAEFEVAPEPPIPALNGWSVNDDFTIDTFSNKTLPVIDIDWNFIDEFDDHDDSDVEGISSLSLRTLADPNVGNYTAKNNGTMKQFSAGMAYLDPRYGTTLLKVHRNDDGKDPPGDFIYTGRPSIVEFDRRGPYGYTGTNRNYWAVYSNWGELHRMEQQSFRLDFEDSVPDANNQLRNAQNWYMWDDTVHLAGIGDSSGNAWYYESGEAGEGKVQDRELMYSCDVWFYEGQYIFWSNALGYAIWTGSYPANLGWHEWTEQAAPTDQLFSYWYNGVPSQLILNQTADWLASDAFDIFGPLSQAGMRSFTCDMTGFTTFWPVSVPFVGNVATTHSFDVMLSGFILGSQIVEGSDPTAPEFESIVQIFKFLSGEGSGDLEPLLGSFEPYFPLGVASRN